MIGRLARRPEPVFAVALGALFLAALATVVAGPPAMPSVARSPSPSPTAIPGPVGLPQVVTLAASSHVGWLYAVMGDEPAQLVRSTDGGLKWSVLSARLPAASGARGFDELIADPVTAGAFYLVRGATIYRFTDDDTTLRPVPAPAGAQPDPFTGAFAIPPWQEGTIFRRISERGVSRTYDGGRTWVAFTLPGPVKSLAAAPSSPGHLYAVANRVVWESTDYGAKWFSRSPADPLVFGNALAPSLAVHPNDQYRLFAGTAAGLYVSTDSGGVWKLAWTAPPSASTNAEAVWRFAFEPKGFDIYATRLTSPTAQDNPTLFSRDGGRTWEESALTKFGARQIVFTGWPDMTLFVGTLMRGVFVGSGRADDLKPRSEGLAPAP